MARWIVVPVVVIPACAGMVCINHWIPAFAGMTARAFRLSPGGYGPPRPLVPDLLAAGRRRSITCIHVGVSINDRDSED